MITPEPELQQRFVAALLREEEDSSGSRAEHEPLAHPGSANYLVPMLLHLTIEQGNHIVDHVPRESSIDHAVNCQILAATIGRFKEFSAAYFDHAVFPDPVAEQLLAEEHSGHYRRHVIASFQQGLWNLMSDGEGLRVALSQPARRTALHLVAQLAERAQHPSDVIELLDRTGTADEPNLSDLAMLLGTSGLEVFSQSAPRSWASLCAGLGFTMDMLGHFRAWFLDLALSGTRRWFVVDELWQDWTVFTDRMGIPRRTYEQFESVVDLHIVTPAEAVSWGVQAPFFRVGEMLAIWPFAFHVLAPDLGFLSLLIRRYEKLWSTTVGSTLALAADWLGGKITPHPRLKWVARRRKSGIGDADLLFWDRETDDIVTLEMKTTFDKFRSHVQLRNFVEQRVNFPKAIKQAHRAANAIADGSWSMRDLFGSAAPAAPRSVTPGVLTWWDTFNPTLGTLDEVLSCNYATFVYVLNAAQGDLAAAVRTIRELASIPCAGVLIPWSIALENREQSAVRQEVQTDALPPVSAWPPVSRLTAELLDPLVRLPEEWRKSASGPDTSPTPFIYGDKEAEK